MKKKLFSVLLICVMVLAFAAPVMAADALQHGDVAALLDTDAAKIAIPAEKEATDTLTQEEAAAYLLLWCGMDQSQLGTYPADWNAMALSAAIADLDAFDPTAPCTEAEFEAMKANAQPLYDALHADKMQPLFINGVAQPIFPYTSGAVEEGYSNADSDIIRYFVYVETNYDTDSDGKLDLVKALVQVPRAAVEGDYKAATIYEARPYITGCTPLYGYDSDVYGTEGYDIEKMYSQPEARKAAGKATTMEAAAEADSSEWYYVNPYESYPDEPFYDYEDLDWYDYYLVRGFAVVECGGLGTRDSEGFETCGSDLEIDAFKCVIEWLHGDRVAYTDKEKNISIEADWSNGKVGMTGRSYAGTTQFGLATTGVEGLETIVPVAGIASWYEYTNSQGISTRTNVAYTDALAGYCAGRYLDEEDWNSIVGAYGNYLYQLMLDQQATNGDYSEHWAIRDYTLDAENIKCSALIVHGLNDYNVRTKEMELMYNAFDKAGIEAKILLHQDGHLTPTYPSSKFVFSIGDQSYDEILNKWFSHYLYDVDNGAEDMAAVTAQDSHDTDKWNTYDSWKTDDIYNMTVDADNDSTTTITSDYSSNGITRSNWQNKLTAGTTNCSVMYKETVDCDTTIKGTVAVNFSAATANTPESTLLSIADTESVVTPNGTDHDALMETLGAEGITTSDSTTSAEKDYPIIERDGLMVSAMLVDIAPEGETFPAFNTKGSYVPKETIAEGGAWMGGGLENFDLVKLTTSDVSYKIISRGWMDLCNPTAGFDSATADSKSKVQLGDGKYYDYTIYLQSTVYTIEEGHTLALVIYPYEQGMARVTQNYNITVKDASVSADIPVNALPFEDVEGHWALNYITRAYNDGIMNGTGATTFEPESTFTRAMLATTLYRLEGEPKVTAENPFTDVKDGEWYTDAVIWAAENGIVKGITEDTFAPNDIATREQFATMMYRYAQYKQVDVTVSEDFVLSFDDADKVSEYAVDAMKWAVKNELINGRTEKDLVPQGLTKRAEAAAILVRFDENIVK